MNNSNNNADNQYLLNVPLAYILQNKTVQEVEQDFDSNGWNVLHHAVAEGDLSKILELCHFSFNWKVNGTSNFILESAYQMAEKKKSTKTRMLNRMPYCDGGYAPTHLAMYLYEFYSNIAITGDFFYQSLCRHYITIMDLLINKNSNWSLHIDSNGNSLFDYAFLSEDLYLIEMMKQLDPTFSNLKKVSPTVAKKILEVMNFKKAANVPQHLFQELDNKIMNDSLSKDLKINSIQKKSIQKV